MSEEAENPVAEYPKWIDHPTQIDRVTKDGTNVMVKMLVKDAKEEAALIKKADWKK